VNDTPLSSPVEGEDKRNGACTGAQPLCVGFCSPFAKGGYRGIGPGVAWKGAHVAIRLDSCFRRNDRGECPPEVDRESEVSPDSLLFPIRLRRTPQEEWGIKGVETRP